jgi:hypothetical protein
LIPKRPVLVYYDDGTMAGATEMAEYEHAVAQRAVETLRNTDCLEPGQAFAVPTPCNLLSCPRCSALHDIDASGWKP